MYGGRPIRHFSIFYLWSLDLITVIPCSPVAIVCDVRLLAFDVSFGSDPKRGPQ